MSRLWRFLAIPLLCGALFASTALAGPGGPGGGPKSSGDPEIPTSARLATAPTNQVVASKSTRVSEGVGIAGVSRWSLRVNAAQTYILWVRVFSR